MRVKDIMIPRSQVVSVPSNAPSDEIVGIVSQSSHSRLPVLGENVDDVKGILLAKDLLRVTMDSHNQDFDMSQIIRRANFVSEDKRLNVLLKEFRESRQHMAIVIDEYGSMCGIVTIEDVLEQIVGDIEDETDVEDENYIKEFDKQNHVVKALTLSLIHI